MRISPVVNAIRPDTQCSRVLLPTPFGPSKQAHRPGATDKLTPRRTSCLP